MDCPRLWCQAVANDFDMTVFFFVQRGRFGAVIMGSFALYNIVSSFKGSTDVMGNQRRRVSQPARLNI